MEYEQTKQFTSDDLKLIKTYCSGLSFTNKIVEIDEKREKVIEIIKTKSVRHFDLVSEHNSDVGIANIADEIDKLYNHTTT